MVKRKYMISGGLAFSERKDMQKLEKQASKGWHLEQFGSLGYRLIPGEPARMQYELDYHSSPDQDYFQLYQDAGWEYVCSLGETTHIFRAPAETNPLYTKQQDKQDVYQRQKHQFGRYALVSLVIFLLTITIFSFLSSLFPDSPWINIVNPIVTGFTLIPLVFTAGPYFGYQYKVHRLRQKEEA